MAEKLTTIDQLKKLALRTKADSAARVSELAEMIAAGLEDAQIGFTVTLPAANWSGRAQTVQGNRGGRDHCIPAPQHC